MRLAQFTAENGARKVGLVDENGSRLNVLRHTESVYGLARAAINEGRRLADLVRERVDAAVDYDAIVSEGRLLAPVDHPDPAHCLVTGTGLTHLGSASTRNSMHIDEKEHVSDSMKMFRWGVEGGKPANGEVGVQPEWFYKGDGSQIAAPGEPLVVPSFALDGGEEPEMTGLYLIGPDGSPWRLGFAIGNEFSDHVMEKQNYLYLAHSKLRTCAFGPELRVGPLPGTVRGMSRIHRGGKVLWQKEFVSGEDNMSHSFRNLEHHHFKYSLFRRPGDLHVHFFGTATLSVADGIRPEAGDQFEISAEGFGKPLRNALVTEDCPPPVVRDV